MQAPFAPSTLCFQRDSSAADKRWFWSGAALWLILAAALTGMELAGNTRTVIDVYANGANRWLAGDPLYEGHGMGFLYAPQAAILFSPFAVLPNPARDILWRSVMVALCGSSLWAAVRVGAGRGVAIGGKGVEVGSASTLAAANSGWMYFLASVGSVPLCWLCGINGQATLINLGCGLWCFALVERKQFTLATAVLCLGFAMKPLLLVYLLLLMAVSWPMRWRLGLGLASVAAFPMLFDSPSHVLEQYGAFRASLRAVMDLGIREPWAQLFGMLKVAGLDVGVDTQMVVRSAAALAVLGLCIFAWRRLPQTLAHEHTWTLATLYTLLMSARSENNTYSLLAPSLGLAVAWGWQTKRPAAMYGAIAATIVTIGGYEFARPFTSPANSIWLAPLVACGFTVAVLVRMNNEFRRAADAREALKEAAILNGSLAPGEIRTILAEAPPTKIARAA